MSNNYDVVDLAVDAYEVSDGVSSATDKLDGAIENINMVSELYKWATVYNAEGATVEQKQYAAVEIMNLFFAFNKNNLPSEIGSSLFDTSYLYDGMYIIGKEQFEIFLNAEYINAEGEKEEFLEELLKNIDAAYEAYCIAIKEGAEQDFPKISSEWDLFYASYTENNDPLNNTVEMVSFYIQYTDTFLVQHSSPCGISVIP